MAAGSARTSSFSRFAQRSLTLRPAHSRRSPNRDPLSERFSHFVTSMTAPVASGWSEFAGWDLHPLESAAFARRTPDAVVSVSPAILLFDRPIMQNRTLAFSQRTPQASPVARPGSSVLRSLQIRCGLPFAGRVQAHLGAPARARLSARRPLPSFRISRRRGCPISNLRHLLHHKRRRRPPLIQPARGTPVVSTGSCCLTG